MKRYFEWLSVPLALILSPIAILITVAIPFIVAFSIVGWHADMEENKIQKEITDYVLENKDSIELNTPRGYQSFVYTYTPTFDGGIEFGYYYSEDNTYIGDTSEKNRYRKGYRTDAFGGDPFDWYYTEKICDQWFYYEDHDG